MASYKNTCMVQFIPVDTWR